MAEQVLDLDRHVVGDARVGRVKRLDEPHRVCRSIEEIGIAERDVPRPGGDLRRDIGEHDVQLDDPELPVIHRHDRTVPAQVPAPA